MLHAIWPLICLCSKRLSQLLLRPDDAVELSALHQGCSSLHPYLDEPLLCTFLLLLQSWVGPLSQRQEEKYGGVALLHSPHLSFCAKLY